MSMLVRYKKSHKTLLELVRLIEESAEPKRSNLMNMVMQEDAGFGAKVQARLFDWEKFKKLDEGIVAEVISACSVKILVLALHQEDEAFLKMAERCLGNKFADYRSEKEIYSELPPSDSQVDSARRKMISEARKLESAGAIKMMDYEQLDGGMEGGANTNAQALNVANQAGAGMSLGSSSGVLSLESGAPSVASFNMETPPPGLSGERFEAHVKRSLGIK